MSLLTLKTLHLFSTGDRVRVKRHGYQQHHEAVIHAFDLPDDPEGRDIVRVDIDGFVMSFYVDGEYATVASPGTPWDAIPHPQSEEWSGIVEGVQAEIDAEIDALADVEPVAWSEVPDSLKRALGLGDSEVPE